jgi:hypothetical protein
MPIQAESSAWSDETLNGEMGLGDSACCGESVSPYKGWWYLSRISFLGVIGPVLRGIHTILVEIETEFVNPFRANGLINSIGIQQNGYRGESFESILN